MEYSYGHTDNNELSVHRTRAPQVVHLHRFSIHKKITIRNFKPIRLIYVPVVLFALFHEVLGIIRIMGKVIGFFTKAFYCRKIFGLDGKITFKYLTYAYRTWQFVWIFNISDVVFIQPLFYYFCKSYGFLMYSHFFSSYKTVLFFPMRCFACISFPSNGPTLFATTKRNYFTSTRFYACVKVEFMNYTECTHILFIHSIKEK